MKVLNNETVGTTLLLKKQRIALMVATIFIVAIAMPVTFYCFAYLGETVSICMLPIGVICMEAMYRISVVKEQHICDNEKGLVYLALGQVFTKYIGVAIVGYIVLTYFLIEKIGFSTMWWVLMAALVVYITFNQYRKVKDHTEFYVKRYEEALRNA